MIGRRLTLGLAALVAALAMAFGAPLAGAAKHKHHHHHHHHHHPSAGAAMGPY